MKEIAAMPDGVNPHCNALRAELARAEPEIIAALPPHIAPARFMRCVRTAVEGDADLRKCDRDSLWAACRECARDGLLPNGREAVIATRHDPLRDRMVAVHWPLPAGLAKAATRSRSVASITTGVIYEGEKHRIAFGDTPEIMHERDPDAPGRSPPIASYAVVTLRAPDGGPLRDGNGRDIRDCEALTWDEAERDAAPDGGGMWAHWPGEAARLAAVRRVLARVPLHPDDTALLRVAGIAAPVAEAA